MLELICIMICDRISIALKYGKYSLQMYFNDYYTGQSLSFIVNYEI